MKPTPIDERATVPLFAVFASLPFLFGGILWLGSIDSKASQALQETRKIDEIQKAVTRLEIKFGTLPKQQGDKNE